MLLGSLGDKAAQLFLGCLKLLGDCCIVADHLFLRCFKQLGDCRIVADHLFLASLELLDAGLERLELLLYGGKETARHRLEQLFLRAGGGWRRVCQKRPGRKCRLRRCRL